MNRFTLEAGRFVTDTLTGDQFSLCGYSDTDAYKNYDPCRLDALARRIVDLLNACEGYESYDVADAIQEQNGEGYDY